MRRGRVNLRGRRVWVTGASAGIGEALLAPLSQAGARLAISARRAARLEVLRDRWAAAGSDVLVLPADVTDRAAMLGAAQRIEDAWGGVDLAIFNAGTYSPVSGTALDAGEFERQMQVNYMGVVNGIAAVLPGMLRRGTGHIAATSSLTAYLPLPNAAAYGASKAALTYMLRALRFDLLPRGVGVTVIHPGFVSTPLTAGNDFWMPALIGGDAAARIIVHGLARGKEEIHFPGRLSWPVKMLSSVPYPLYDRLTRLALRLTGQRGG